MEFLLGLVLLLAPQDDKTKSIEVTVLDVRGSAEFKIPGKGKKWAKVAKGATLKRGTMIQTGIKSRCVLQFGKDTKVLIRPSTFAVINESFLKKNEFEGELRVDVGSVHVETDEKKEEKLKFRVRTPQGTAAVRGTALTVRTNAVGMETLGHRGVTDVRTLFGSEYRIGVHLRQLATSTAGDLARMFRNRGPRMTNDNLSRLEKLLGNRDWATRGLNPSDDTNSQGQKMHPSAFCWPEQNIGAFTHVSMFRCTSLYQWDFTWDVLMNFWIDIKGVSPATTAVMTSPTRWELRLHGRTLYYFDNFTGIDWEMLRPGQSAFYQWQGGPDQWVPQ